MKDKSRKHHHLFVVCLIIAFCISGVFIACDNQSDTNDQLDINDSDSRESLSGITLGTSQERVIEILGRDYAAEEYADDAGYLKEDAYQWTYENRIDLLIGRDSHTVIQVRAFSDDIQTALGVKVGDNATEAFSLYRKHYDEVISRHDNVKLNGWFDVGNDMVLIFDTNKDDNKIVNDEILPESKIEAVYLKYQSSID